jgi:hypothetical protein
LDSSVSSQDSSSFGRHVDAVAELLADVFGRVGAHALSRADGLCTASPPDFSDFHEVLRVVLGRLDLAAGFLGLRRDLLLDLAHGLAAVGLPLHLVALLELVAHGRVRTRECPRPRASGAFALVARRMAQRHVSMS